MRTSTDLPVLKFVAVELLVPHEDTDPRRVEKLVKRIMDEQVLKNPPIVSIIPDDNKYMILDGANRSMAFKTMGVPHLVGKLCGPRGGIGHLVSCRFWNDDGNF
jgi:hypothetical protein